MKIFDLKYDRPFRDEFQALCESIFDEGFLTNHKLVSEFEEQFAKFQNVKYSLAVSNGTSALELGLGILNVKNKEVLIPVNTFIATYLAVKKAGGIPVLCDIEPGYFSISAKEIEKKVTKNTAAIIVVHIGGHISPEVKLVKKLCKQHNLQLFEDAAHAHGATLDKVTAGNWGAMAAFSHFMTKVMTMGEGGSITFNDQEAFEKGRSLRQFGMSPENSILHEHEGGNFKITEFQAALGLLELKRINKRILKRQVLAKRYFENLKGTNWNVITDTDGSKGSYYKQIIIPPVSREIVSQQLSRAGIPLTGGVYDFPLHQQPVVYNSLKDRDFPIASSFCAGHICPPCFPELELEDIDKVCQVLVSIEK